MRAILILALLTTAAARAAVPLPTASNLVERIIDRAQVVARAPQTNRYTYEKRSLNAELDEKDRVIKSTEKLYKVLLIGGLPFPRLVKVQGRDLTAQELEKQNERENAFRQRVTRVDLQRKAKRKEGVVTRELVDRFDFKVTKREVVDGRKTLVLTFAGRPGGSEKTIEDKVYKHVFGTVWVDEEEAEVVKFDAAVHGPIPLGWFGAIGSLNKFQATMERMRMPDGVWVNRKSTFLLVARKLFSTMRYKTTEESSRFARE
jgi:hypothetical protein